MLQIIFCILVTGWGGKAYPAISHWTVGLQPPVFITVRIKYYLSPKKRFPEASISHLLKINGLYLFISSFMTQAELFLKRILSLSYHISLDIDYLFVINYIVGSKIGGVELL